MKKAYLFLIGASLPVIASAQSAVDVQQITQPDFKGTARFMSMGGAFTALGGDLSTLSQNPAGIGIYRSNEVGISLDINMQKTETPFNNTNSQTKVYCNNFGYVGATRLDGALRTFNWGVSFSRTASFDRVFKGYVPTINTSLSNYVAAFTNGVPAADMESSDWNTYNPYLDSDIDWLSILAYNSYMINPVGVSGTGNLYEGLFRYTPSVGPNGEELKSTNSDALFTVREKGGIDEYNISFGGNVEDVVYWGLSIGITDLNYKRWTYYSEDMANANVVASNGDVTNGAYGYDLNNFKNITGSGWNLKAGVIVKPINEFRLGLAVHTPTFYRLNQSYSATNDFAFTPTDENGNAVGETTSGNEYTEDAYFEWKLNSPWKLMLGAAAVVGNRAIISADYEFAGYNSMSIKTPYYYDNWGGYDFVSDDGVNDAISTYYRNQNSFRLGVEYRVTPQFSVRAGCNFVDSNVKKEAYNGQVEIQTSGTDPSYTFDNKTTYLTCGVGYKYQSWYIDAAYVYKDRESKYSAFTNWDGNIAPQAKVTDHNSSIVLSTGFRF